MSAYAGWERGECRIVTPQTRDDGEPVLAWFSDETPGLAVTQVADSEYTGFYSITHTSSGRAVAKGFITLTDAKNAAIRLAKLTDWTRPRNALSSEAGLGKRVAKALRRAE